MANPDSNDVITVKKDALKCILAWGAVEKGIPAESMPTLLTLVTTHIQYRPTFEISCQVLTELLTFKDLLVHEKTVCEGLLPVLTQGVVFEEYQKCLQEEDAEVGHTLCLLLSQLGESFPKYMIKNLGTSQDVLRLVEMMLRFTGFPGYYGMDEELSLIPNEFWYEFQESLTDDTVIPLQPPSTTARPDLTTDPVTHEPVIHGSGAFDGTRIATRFLNRSSASGWDMSGFPEGSVERIWGIAKEVFGALVGVVRAKVERPGESTLSEWSLDMRDKFRVYRIDKAETLLSCHRVLGVQMYEILVPLAVRQVQEIVAGQGEDGQALEATLYTLKSIAEEVHVNNAPHLHIVFGDTIMGQVSKFPAQFWRVRLTLCLLIGEARHPNWLAKNPSYLLPVITFLMNSLSVSPHITTGAIHSLEQVCSTCRRQLGPIAKNMLDAWEKLKNSLNNVDRIRLIRAVSSILEPLPPHEQLPHVMTLTGSMITEIRTTLAVLAASPNLLSQPPEVEVAERMLVRDLLRLIKGVCQGIQKSEGSIYLDEDEDESTPMDSTQQPPIDSGFNMDQIDVSIKANLGQLSGVIWETIGAVFHVFAQDEETIDIVCGLIGMTLDTTIPIMFTPNPTKLAAVLIQSFSTNQFPIILRVFTVLCLSVKEGQPSDANNDTILSIGDKSAVRQWVAQRVYDVNEVTFRVLLADGGMTERPDLIEYYFKFLTKVLNTHPWALIQLPQNHQQMLFGTLVPNGLTLQERASCTAVFEFVRDLVSLKVNAKSSSSNRRSGKSMEAESLDSVEAKDCKDMLNGAVRSIGANVVRILLMSLGSGLPTSMWPTIADLLHRIIHHFPDEAKHWVVSCLQVDGFPTQHCNKEDKEEFVKGMMV
ncbi:hypothetical protein BCR33DRAFT_39718 [Rhizoclosmatium globosum]|uniref:Uncharacterized protein n=1 Tax=Rhizoclosmatium globosum TaxID=329046 RepID=A0A1Y2CNM7_9FUNG|nr:hypothetical protein BCR33DRAFT_39718 [Rhizoclosmatium globosum]|eukprot:ORY48602.1 hypothetical protein BCR33DRAFT_39718 [Rhizoclosmatium globosum]